MPAGDASLKTAQVNQNAIDSNHGIYRKLFPLGAPVDRD
jgi:hypothetical protein